MTSYNSERGYQWWIARVIVPILASSGVAVVIGIVLKVILEKPSPPPPNPPIICEGVAKAGTTAGYVLVDTSHNQDQLERFTEGVRESISTFCKPRDSLIGGTTLEKAAVLILALPFRDRLTPPEINEIAQWVERGGGLLLMGYYAWTHHNTNVNELAARWRIRFKDNLVMPGAASQPDTRAHVFGTDPSLAVWVETKQEQQHGILNGVKKLAFMSSCAIDIADESRLVSPPLSAPHGSSLWKPEGPLSAQGVRENIVKYTAQGTDSVPLLVALRSGRGRVVFVGTWKIASLDYGDNRQLLKNIIGWLSGSADLSG